MTLSRDLTADRNMPPSTQEHGLVQVQPQAGEQDQEQTAQSAAQQALNNAAHNAADMASQAAASSMSVVNNLENNVAMGRKSSQQDVEAALNLGKNEADKSGRKFH